MALNKLSAFKRLTANICSKKPATGWEYLTSVLPGNGSKVAALQIMVVCLTFVKEIVMTSFLGLAQFMDAYTLVNNILIFTRSYFEQLGYGALVPTLAYSYQNQLKPEVFPEETTFSQKALLTVLLNYALLFTIVVGGTIFFFHHSIAWLMAPTWTGQKLVDLFLLTSLVLPCCLMFQIAEMFRVLCIHEKRFSLYQLPRIASLLLFIVCFIILLKPLGPISLAIALPVSQLVELLIYCIGLKIKPQWAWRTIGSIPFLQKVLPVSLSWGVFSLSALVDNFFLSFLYTGEPSAFRYAYVSVLIAGSLTVVNLQMIKLADLNQACSENNIGRALFILKDACTQIMVWSLPLIASSIVLAPELIKFVYERGAFTPHNTLLVSQCFQILVIMVPYTALWRLISSCYYNLDLTRPLLLIGFIFLLLRIGMDYLGTHLYGLQGISWMVLINSYLLLVVLSWFLFSFARKTSSSDSASS